MRVRSITLFATIDVKDPQLQPLITCTEKAREALTTAGYEVQTVRLALPPWPFMTNGKNSDVLSLAKKLDTLAIREGLDYVSLGPVVCRNVSDLKKLLMIPKVLAATQRIFTTALFADASFGLNIEAAKEIAKVIQNNSRIESNGISNMRFAALANVGPGIPFFPAAYAELDEPLSLALAIESGDLLVDIFTGAKNLQDAGTKLSARIEYEGKRLLKAIEPVCMEHDVQFRGLDISLAPFPSMDKSTAAGIEALGAAPFGAAGTLSVVSMITNAIRHARFPHCGFNGLMLPVLEDALLASRSGENTYTLHSLLLFSAVCGTGLDTIPLPGDISETALAGLLLDVGTLAIALNKPLTARLMPVPGKQAGDVTQFNSRFITNAKVMKVTAPSEGALLSGRLYR